ncbi:MAG: hypothetical protein IPM94_08410 [bacterium]|nr:hypothetical protein [bacterium]
MFQRFVVPAARLLMAAGLVMWPAAASAWEMLSYQDDPVDMAVDESLDITAASVEQQGGRLLFTIALRGDLPTSLPGADDSQTYLWYVDADEDPSTGQNHGAVGSEFNVRVVIGETYGGGWVDITGGMPGGAWEPSRSRGRSSSSASGWTRSATRPASTGAARRSRLSAATTRSATPTRRSATP